MPNDLFVSSYIYEIATRAKLKIELDSIDYFLWFIKKLIASLRPSLIISFLAAYYPAASKTLQLLQPDFINLMIHLREL